MAAAFSSPSILPPDLLNRVMRSFVGIAGFVLILVSDYLPLLISAIWCLRQKTELNQLMCHVVYNPHVRVKKIDASFVRILCSVVPGTSWWNDEHRCFSIILNARIPFPYTRKRNEWTNETFRGRLGQRGRGPRGASRGTSQSDGLVIQCDDA